MMSSTAQRLNMDSVSEQELHLKLENLASKNSDLVQESEFYKRKHGLITQELEELLLNQTNLETQLTHLETEKDILKKENRDLLKTNRDLETKIAKESKQFDGDKLNWFNKEVQLRDQIRDLNIQINSSKAPESPPTKSRLRSVSMSVVNHPPPIFSDDEDVPDTKTQATLIHENKLANKTIRIQLKEISELKSTMTKLQQEITALGDQNRRSRQVEEHLRQEIAQLKRANVSLQEDNESYQLLLRDRTLAGQFNMESYLNEDQDDFAGNGQQTLGDALSVQLNGGGSTLAAALGGDFGDSGAPSSPTKERGSSPDNAKTKAELKQANEENKKLKDENKALALYISKILGKIMSNPVLAEALSISKDDDEEKKQAGEKSPPNAAQSLLSPGGGQGGKVSFDLPRRSPTTAKAEPSSATNNSSSKPTHPRRSKSVSVSGTSSIFFSFKSPFKKTSPPAAKPEEAM